MRAHWTESGWLVSRVRGCGRLLVSHHFIRRFRDRYVDAVDDLRFYGKPDKDLALVVAEMYECMERGDEGELRPWLNLFVRKRNERLYLHRDTRVVMVARASRPENCLIAVTCFRAVCRTCGTHDCEHVDYVMPGGGLTR